MRPRFADRVPPEIRGRSATPRGEQGKPGARCTRSRACRIESMRVSHHRSTGITRPSLRNGFNGFLRALPGDRALLPPSSPRSVLLENLTPASGRQDHTASPSADKRLRLWRRLTSIASLPYVRDDRETPLCVGRDGEDEEVICLGSEPKYFCERGWTGVSVIARRAVNSGYIGPLGAEFLQRLCRPPPYRQI